MHTIRLVLHILFDLIVVTISIEFLLFIASFKDSSGFVAYVTLSASVSRE
jgi:hypothetical protein